MKIRILTGAIGIPIILLCLFTARPLMILMVTLIMVMSQFELSRMYGSGHDIRLFALPVAATVVMIGFYLFRVPDWLNLSVVMGVVIIALVAIAFYPTLSLHDVVYCIFAFIYGSWFVMHTVILYDRPRGSFLLLALFIGVWCCDSGAYFVGRIMGKHKLAPQLSPKKTIEGAIGGIMVTLVAIMVLNFVLHLFSSTLLTVTFAFIVSVLGIIGDLFESFLKRMLDVKDSGRILPGHGGVLDRFDSFVFVVPLCSYLLIIID